MSDNNERGSDVIRLAQHLIQTPSRAGIDPPDGVIDVIRQWCERRGLLVDVLIENSLPVGMVAVLHGKKPGRSLCLNACIDTAPFGDLNSWTHGPIAGEIVNGRLYGRGAADSKTAAAIFLVLFAELQATQGLEYGDLTLLLDADEHTGGFAGVRRFAAKGSLPEACWIGYPGNHSIVVGSRGFLRGTVSVRGVAAHTGGKSKKGVNAILRAADLVRNLGNASLPEESDPDFSFGPSLSVTSIEGGEGFSVVPDLCKVRIDARLTPQANSEALKTIILDAMRNLDASFRSPRQTTIEWHETWPPFRTPDNHPTIVTLRTAAEKILGRPVTTVISGPSNIGNYLASLGVAPMSGFGVTYDNVHAADEWCDIGSINAVYEIYKQGVLSFTQAS